MLDRTQPHTPALTTIHTHPRCHTYTDTPPALLQVIKAASAVGARLNAKREARGLRPRAVRAVVIGFPNVGKSALINRLLGRRMAESAPKPGVTRVLRWARVAGSELDLLDAPGGARAEMAG